MRADQKSENIGVNSQNTEDNGNSGENTDYSDQNTKNSEKSGENTEDPHYLAWPPLVLYFPTVARPGGPGPIHLQLAHAPSPGPELKL